MPALKDAGSEGCRLRRMPALKDTNQGRSTDHCSSAAPCRQAQGDRAPGKEKSDAADAKAGRQREEPAEAGYRPTCKTHRHSQCCPGHISHEISCTPSKRGKFCYRNSGFGAPKQTKRSTRAGERLHHPVL